MKRGTPIVIVEDDEAHRDLVAHMLEVVAPDCRVFAFGIEAREHLAAIAPPGALVLLDRRLGARDSLELIHPLRRARTDLTVVVMSAFVTAEDRVICLAAGANSVFQKPADLNGWRSTLMSLFDDDRSERPEARAA